MHGAASASAENTHARARTHRFKRAHSPQWGYTGQGSSLLEGERDGKKEEKKTTTSGKEIKAK